MNARQRCWDSDDLPGLWTATVLVLIFAVAAVLPLTPHDLWFHVRLGQEMVEQRALITTDVFSYTRFGQPYFNNAWFAEIVLYALWTAGGAPLFVLARALLVASFYAIVFWLTYRASRSERWSAAFVWLAALASFPHWQLRPQTLVLPIFAGYVWILTRYLEERRASLWALPLLMILWVNLHGSFVFGLMLVGLAVMGEVVQRVFLSAPVTARPERTVPPVSLRAERSNPQRANWGLLRAKIALAMTEGSLLYVVKWGLLTFAAMLVNPLGLGILNAVLEIRGDPSIQGWVLEWLPPNPREFPASVFYLLVIAFLFGLAFSRKRLALTQWLWVATFIWLGWIAYRNVLWACAILAPLLAMQFRDRFSLRECFENQHRRLESRQRKHEDCLRGLNQPAEVGFAQLLLRFLTAQSQFLFRPRRLRLMRGLTIAALTLVVVGALPPLRAAFAGDDLRAWVSSDTPVEAVNYLRAHDLRGRTFHEIGAGSYLMWALYPQQQVFVDARINLYPADLWREYFAVTNGLDGFEDILDQYRIDYLLVDAFWQPQLLTAVEKRTARWSLLFHSGESYLFQRVAAAR